MLKLSRRNWNNVLILVVLVLMFVLYGIPQRLQQLNASEQRLIPADTELLMVAFAQQRLIKAGPVWQLQPINMKNRDASQLALAWQHSVLTPVSVPANKSRIPIAQASVQLVGQRAPLIWLLYPDSDAELFLLQEAGQSQFYQITAAQAALLFLL
ncbi:MULTISPECIES: hypothetical protein [Rheinheimera]|uniref:hypothetical protein n=1 Tax=Rheinheimera TaxID=67575 RepID=UPI00104A14AA|nr:hypothetical protein [Rheinheimera sp. D18]QBL10409.1 hypothetical protein E0Z06_13165 [Rheinheimera sp. D18]